ncbi:MAG: hypothetical protein KGI11_09190 [Thaumarchaeota archaeon]|nr:hypothetical protein [Nitrososphaerota archaeon]
MKTLHLAIGVIMVSVLILHVGLAFGQNENSTSSVSSNQTQVLKFSNEQYPTDGKTGQAVTINGTITNLIDKDVRVMFTLQSDGYSQAWHMICSKPYSLFGFENMTVPAGKSIDYQYKIRLLKSGTYFFVPEAQVQGLKDAEGNYINYEAIGKRGSITITGEDVDKMPFIRTGPGESNVSVATGGKFVYVMWQGKGVGDRNNIFLASSDNNGTNFTQPIDISSSPTVRYTQSDSTEPVMAAEGREVYAMWKDTIDSIGEFPSIFVMGGDIHKPSYGTGRASTGWAQAGGGKIVLSGNNYYSTWIEHWPTKNSTYSSGLEEKNDRPHGRVYFGSNKLDVIGWRPRLMSNDIDDSLNPQIAADGNNVFLAWEEHGLNGTNYLASQIYLSYSLDGGMTFHTLLASGDDKNSTNPKISVSGGKLYLAYRDSKNNLVLMRRVVPFLTYSTTTSLYHGTSTLVLRGIESKNNTLSLLWTETDNGKNIVFLSSISDHSNSPDSPIVLGKADGRYPPRMALQENNLYVTWINDLNGTDAVLFKNISDAGGADNTIILNNDSNPMNPYVDASGNNVFVAWTDASPDTYHVFFRASHDNGMTFGPTSYLEGKAPAIQHGNNFASIGTIAGLIFMAGVSTIGVIVGILYVMRKRKSPPLNVEDK